LTRQAKGRIVIVSEEVEMKQYFAFFLASAAAFQASALTPLEAANRILWYGQNALRLELDGKVVWIDPVGVPSTQKADIILLTHDHGDHFSASTVKALSGPDTKVLAGFDRNGLTRIKPGEKRSFGGLTVEAVPMYNIKKSAHPRSKGYCGFVLSAGGIRIYDAGDTERIPEMKEIACDVVLLPLGQTYTMGSVEEAVQAALDVKAKVAIPVHYGMYEGTEADADRFVADLRAKGVEAFRLKRLAP
jgi:L-ascorbate metabolism protein UlaG (beta-lactamase superfamily)